MLKDPSSARHVLVTGAARGIGRSVAQAFIASGERVTVLCRTLGSAERTARELDAGNAISADVTDDAALEAALTQAAALAGPVEVLVNNAGGVETAPLVRTDTAALNRMVARNVAPVLTAIRVVVPAMRQAGAGRIITIASTAGLKGYPYVSAYCAAKHAAVGLTRALALELATTGITVNAVCPGYTDTDLVTGAISRLKSKTGRDEASLRAEFERHNPQGRLVSPDEVASAVLWLASPGASAVTGQAIAVAGGEL